MHALRALCALPMTLCMPLVNARQAAELTGKDRSTLLRAVSSGRLSATRDDRGQHLFDPAELERVYGSLRAHQGDAHAVREAAYAHNPDAQALEIERLRTMVEMLERERRTSQETLEHERRSFEEERTFLRGMLERQTEQVKLLTDERQQRDRHSPSVWARLFRKNA
jgi:hypothetical protein